MITSYSNAQQTRRGTGYDAQGNVAFLTNATGNVTDTYDYDGWGNIVASTGTTPNSRLYMGEELDADLVLLNLRARQYNTASGRFSTIDPMPVGIRTSVGDNAFGYAASDPINRSDPSGLMALDYGRRIDRDLELLAQVEALTLKRIAQVTAVAAITAGLHNRFLNEVAATASVYAAATAALLSVKSPVRGWVASIPGTIGMGTTIGCSLGLAAGYLSSWGAPMSPEDSDFSSAPYCLPVGSPI